MKKLTLYIIFILTVNTFAQNVFKEFTIADSSKNMQSPLILSGREGELLMFFQEDSSVYYSRSTDDGETWEGKNYLSKIFYEFGSAKRFDGVKLDDGTIIVIAANYTENDIISISKDNGDTWEYNKVDLISIIRGFKLSAINDSTLWLVMGSDKNIYQSTDKGKNWNTIKLRNPFSGFHKSHMSLENDKILVAYHINGKKPICGRISENGGISWGPQFNITDDDDYHYNADIEKITGKYYLIYETSTYQLNRSTTPSSIEYITSTDGFIWTEPRAITKYVGPNYKHNTSLVNGELFTSFLSNRFMKNSVWFGRTVSTTDIISPPFIEYVKFPREVLNLKEAVVFTDVHDESRGLNVYLQYKTKLEDYREIEMYEDQEEFKCILPPIFNDDSVYIRVKAEDLEGYNVYSEIDTIIYKNKIIYDKYLLNANRFKLPINNKGRLADIRLQFPNYEELDGGRFNNKVVLFSGGFGLSGYNSEGTLWSNGNMSASRVDDYLPGLIGSVESGLDTTIYIIDKEDEPFGASWKNWEEAVKYGAYFYDGDGDGKYNPIDKNGNNKWDENEDSPDILGDVTTWMVYNDGVDPSIRRYSNVSPQGIEIRQTTWAYNKVGPLNNTIFVRYSLLNTGLVSEYHDSVYFSIWSDPDIGSDGSAYTDDLAGCDTTLNLGYTYNDGYDNDFGNNPPCLVTKYLQGPIVESKDPESLAQNKRGRLGEESIKGYENLSLSSFQWYTGGIPGHDDPNDEYQARNYLIGKNQAGQNVDPCDFFAGEVVNYDCNRVDPKYLFSGDPVNRIGWLNNDAGDLRILSNTGPFKLEKDKPVDIIVAYIVGDGESALNSVTVGKEYAKQIQSFYESNFTQYVVGGIEEASNLIPTELSLSQNYPNPFNPSTTIEYSIPRDVKRQTGNVKGTFIPSGVEGEKVELVVYDVLGREVKTLVNRKQSPGNYKVIFPGHSGEGRNLSSGVYFYRLTHGNNILTKKMILLK